MCQGKVRSPRRDSEPQRYFWVSSVIIGGGPGLIAMIASIEVPPQGDAVDRPTILVVEDEVLVRLDIAEYLRSAGFRVLEAVNAYEAIELLGADKAIDLVFSDISMPGSLNGMDLARWIRHKQKGVQVLLTSGTANNVQLASRDNVVVPKPYLPREVEMSIRRLLGN